MIQIKILKDKIGQAVMANAFNHSTQGAEPG